MGSQKRRTDSSFRGVPPQTRHRSLLSRSTYSHPRSRSCRLMPPSLGNLPLCTPPIRTAVVLVPVQVDVHRWTDFQVVRFALLKVSPAVATASLSLTTRVTAVSCSRLKSVVWQVQQCRSYIGSARVIRSQRTNIDFAVEETTSLPQDVGSTPHTS